MADILIRGMEMPKDGRKHTALLQFLEDGECRGIVEYSKSYDDRSVKVFEVVPLPEGHGRLGDLDALSKEFDRLAFLDWNQKAAPYSWAYAYSEVQAAVDDSPTIVPAEGGTDNG